nr:Protocatechuate 3,4-dioxygenase alpha chain [Cupriavidus sp.]
MKQHKTHKSSLMQTPSQTVGPYFAYGLSPAQYGFDLPELFGPTLASPDCPGEPLLLMGQVFDGQGQPITDALIELSQLDAQGKPSGRALDPVFRGFGRCGTGTLPNGLYAFQTIRPGSAVGQTASCLHLTVFMRGLLVHCFTRVYFEDETDLLVNDPVFQAVPEDRRSTLLARRDRLKGSQAWRFDIHMQGPKETVFFDL